MNSVSEKRQILKIRNEVEEILSGLGVEIGLPDNGLQARAIRNNHRTLYLWMIVLALARAIEAKPTVTVEQLEEVEGVGPQTAQRIVDRLQ